MDTIETSNRSVQPDAVNYRNFGPLDQAREGYIPSVVCHVMSSVDGRVKTESWSNPYKDYSFKTIMDDYRSTAQRLETDAWMLGTTTVKELFPDHFDGCSCHKAYKDQLETYVGDCSSDRLFIALVPDGDVKFNDNRFRGDNIICVVGTEVSADYLEFLESMQISYVFAGPDGKDTKTMLRALYHNFGIRRIALQGGGIIDGTFWQQQLVSEVSVVVYPGIAATEGQPSIFEATGTMPAGQSLQLLETELLKDGCVWLHYKVWK